MWAGLQCVLVSEEFSSRSSVVQNMCDASSVSVFGEWLRRGRGKGSEVGGECSLPSCCETN